MTAGAVAPDQRAFEADVEKPAFRLGEIEGRWKLVRISWPMVTITVAALDGREFALRMNCAGYPGTPPTAGPWDLEQDTVLAFEEWPRGNGGRVSAVFNPGWKNGTALYLPCDREALAGHDAWRTQMPSKIWSPATGITHYLELVHELLHCSDYVADPCPTA